MTLHRAETMPMWLPLLLVTMSMVACGDTPTEPTDEDVGPVTLTVSSTVQALGATSYSFTTTDDGDITVVLASLAQEGAAVGLGLGLQDPSAGCALTYSLVTQVGSAAQIVAAASPGTYCVKVFDTGQLTGPTAFTVTVTHY